LSHHLAIVGRFWAHVATTAREIGARLRLSRRTFRTWEIAQPVTR
jgi:hypothetical protein